jgi:FkbM family methyltransferase
MKHFAISLLMRICRIYFSNFPFRIGKTFVWERVVTPYLEWRHTSTTVTTAFGSKMTDINVRDTVQRYIYFFGVFEPAITQHVITSLRPGDIVIDVGANVGYYTLLAAKLVGATGKVFAIEASPSIFKTLEKNVRANALQNVVTINNAITDTAREVTVYKHEDWNLGGTTIMSTVAARRPTASESIVPGLPLPHVLNSDVICNARLIKIDVEGAEWNVVCGLRQLLPFFSKDTEIILELDPQTLQEQSVSVSEFLNVFDNAGFEAFIISNEYNKDFYLKKRYNPPQRLEGPIGYRTEPVLPGVTDLIFRRRESVSPDIAP